MRTIIVHPDGKVEDMSTEGWKDFKKILNDAFLEPITLADNVCCYVDEDGRLKGLLKNELATNAVTSILEKIGRTLLPGDYIKGIAIFVGTKMSENPEDGLIETDLPDAVCREYFSMAVSS
jgi:hypothetical protein